MSALLLALLVASMLSAGLALKRERLVAMRRDVKALALLVGASFVVLPLIALGLAALFSLPEESRTALLLVAVCAGGASGPALAGLARGDVGAAGVISVALGLTSALVATLFFAAGGLRTFGTLAAQLAPLALGCGLVMFAPRLAQRLERPVSVMSSALLVAIIVGFTALRGHELFLQPLGYLAAAVALVGASVALGHWVAGTAAGLSSGVRNLSLALVLSAPGSPAQSAVLVYGLVMYLGVSAWALYARSRNGAHALGAARSVR